MQTLYLPTQLHEQAIETIQNFFLQQKDVDTILLTNSCARGKAVAESDIDFAVLLKPATQPAETRLLENKWHNFLYTEPVLLQYKTSHRFAQIHLDLINGVYEPTIWDDGGGPDFFEIEIGNHLVYAVALGREGACYRQLRKNWLPYYEAALQTTRLNMVKEACLYDLEHIPFFVKRELFFQAFDRLTKAFQEFLQALFIRHKTYPIAYNKWIKEQVEETLKLPDLYKQLPVLLSVSNMESIELNIKAKLLEDLLHAYC